jgi:hypothetical protein
MLQEFHTDVAEVDQDDAFVVMVLHVYCKLLFLMFPLFFHTYVASVLIWMLHMFHTYVVSVLSGCCVCFIIVFQVFFQIFLQVFRMHVSSVSTFGRMSQVLYLDVCFFLEYA